MRRHTIIIAACLALCAGLGIARLAPFAYGWLLLLLGLAACLCWRRHTVMTLAVVCMLCFGTGWWRGSAAMQQEQARAALHYQKVTIVGRATDEAVYGKRQQLEFVVTEVRVLDPVPQRLIGNITVRGFGEPMVYRGDSVQATGTLYPTRGNNVASIGFAELVVVARDDTVINNLRRRFAAGMQSALPEPTASFALGLLIGQRTTLPDPVSEQLRQVGLTHIIAVSGYNLTVIVMACRRLLMQRSKFQATAACVGLIALFLLITGTSPPVVRAGVISMLGIAAWYYGHDIKPVVLLLLGAAVTVMANPFYLWGNVSWYLSFLAFYGVLVLAPLVCKRIWGTTDPKVFAALVVESACASIAVLPYVLYVFGQTSLVSLVANMLVVPAIPLAMALGLAGGVAGMVLPALAGWLAWPARLLLTYMLDIANLLSRVPYAFVENIGFSLPAMLGSYLVLLLVTVVLWRKTRHIDKRKRLLAAEPV